MHTFDSVSLVLEDKENNILLFDKKPKHVFIFEGIYILVFKENEEYIFTTAVNDDKGKTIVSDDLDDAFRSRLEEYFLAQFNK